jgi:hypothetical protein
MPQLGESSSRRLNTGRTMPLIGLGTWQLTDHTGDTVADTQDRLPDDRVLVDPGTYRVVQVID